MTSIAMGYSRWAIVDARPADLCFLPPVLKKRLTPTISMALEVAHHCTGDQQRNIRSVFCTRYGEYDRTFKMLDTLLNAAFVSPAAFSLSTHNVPSGILAKNTGNRASSTTVSSLVATLETGFLEAAMIAQQYQETVMFLYVDMPLPDVYGPALTGQEEAVALAILLTPDSDQKLQLSWRGNERNANPTSGISLSVRQLHTLLERPSSRGVSLDDGRLEWTWETVSGWTA
jgi:Beta-ketoacyl synthase, N-terminal domain